MATKGEESETRLTPGSAIIKLRSVDFRFNKHWREVARRLQIKQDDRDRYIRRHDGDEATALEECVDDWLRNSREPTWDKFLHIIAEIEKLAARQIRKSIGLPPVTEELTVLELLSDDQLTALGGIPSGLVGTLKAEGIVEEGESSWLKDVTTWKEVIKGLIQVFKNNTDSKKEIILGKILLLYSETRKIGREILQEKPLTPVIVSPTFEQKFDKLSCEFATLLNKIRPKLLQKLPQWKDFKSFLRNINKIKKRIKECKNVEEAIEVVEEEFSSCTNLEIIKSIANMYGCDDVLQDIMEYEKRFESFTDDIRDSLKKHLPVYLCRDRTEPLVCEKLEFKLKWDPDEFSYEDIKFILNKAFEDIAKDIIVHTINGGSVTVLCRIPHSLVPLAIYKAQKNIEFLQKHRMISLTIGYMTVIAKSVEKEVEEDETITGEHYPQKEEEIEQDVTASDTKDETVTLQEIKEELEEKKKQYLQLEERCSDLEKIAQSSATDQMTAVVLERLKEYEEKEQNIERMVAERDDFAKKVRSLESEKKELQKKLTDKENQLMSSIQIEELTQHELALIQQEVQTLQNKKKEAETIMGEVKEKYEKLQTEIADEREKTEKMEAEIKKLQSELDTVKKIKKRMMEENEALIKVKEEYEKLQADIADEREKAEKMAAEKEDKIAAEIEKMAAEKKGLQENLDSVKRMKKVTVMENEKLTREKEKYEAQIKEIKSIRVPTLHDDWRDSEPHTLPVEVLMTSFASHHKSNDHWYSPSFYSHEKGYKLCLRVRANGESQGSGTHLSIHVHLMRGDYDDVLKWPVRGKVTLQLLNRSHHEKHFSGDIEFNDDSNPEATGRVVNGIQISSGTAAFVGQGGATFAPQDLLFRDHLKDDSIRIRVTSVEMEPQSASAVPIEAPTSKSLFEFRVNKFSALKKSNGSYVSDHFHTHEKGYRFVFMVYPNGVGANKGKNVSIFVHLTKGENDDQLKFPFRGEFTLQAVNCRDTEKDHAEKVIRINKFTDPKETYGSRVAWYNVTGRALNGYGFPEFLAHEQLAYNEKNNTQYLDDDDSMLFRVTNITVNSM